MRKSLAYVIVVMLVFTMSCQVKDDISPPEQTPKIRVENGRLVFESAEHFGSVMAGVETGAIKVKNGILEGFNYRSMKTTLPKSSDGMYTTISSVLDLKGYQILLNQNNDVQIADKIYHVEKEFTQEYAANSNALIATHSNTNEVFDKEKKQFVKKNEPTNSERGFDEWESYMIYSTTVVLLPIEVRDQFRRAGSPFLKTYYYVWSTGINNVSYYQFNGGVCLCQNVYQPSPTYFTNVNTASIPIGSSTPNWENGNGYSISVNSSIQMPSYYPLFSWVSHVP